jgi:hypothetical protein
MSTDPANSRTPLASFLIRWLTRLVLGAICLLVAAYLCDWLIFIVRGKPAGQVVVSQYLATPIRGNNTEVDFEGSQPVSCSVALFPQAMGLPCWYLRRHPNQFERP